MLVSAVHNGHGGGHAQRKAPTQMGLRSEGIWALQLKCHFTIILSMGDLNILERHNNKHLILGLPVISGTHTYKKHFEMQKDSKSS